MYFSNLPEYAMDCNHAGAPLSRQAHPRCVAQHRWQSNYRAAGGAGDHLDHWAAVVCRRVHGGGGNAGAELAARSLSDAYTLLQITQLQAVNTTGLFRFCGR
jgi:hypothetical protein